MKNADFFDDYIKVFLEQNSYLNLISKNDEKFLWEKHIFDSLCMENFFEKYYPQGMQNISLLDFGTGGGFPSVPLALAFPEIKVTAVDSIGKKINAVSLIKDKLEIQNLTPLCTRVENLTETFDIVTSRAVASLDKITAYALPKLKKNGFFVAYKSRKAAEEIDGAKNTLKKFNAKVIDVISYDLPLEENHERNLVVIAKCK